MANVPLSFNVKVGEYPLWQIVTTVLTTHNKDQIFNCLQRALYTSAQWAVKHPRTNPVLQWIEANGAEVAFEEVSELKLVGAKFAKLDAIVTADPIAEKKGTKRGNTAAEPAPKKQKKSKMDEPKDAKKKHKSKGKEPKTSTSDKTSKKSKAKPHEEEPPAKKQKKEDKEAAIPAADQASEAESDEDTTPSVLRCWDPRCIEANGGDYSICCAKLPHRVACNVCERPKKARWVCEKCKNGICRLCASEVHRIYKLVAEWKAPKPDKKSEGTQRSTRRDALADEWKGTHLDYVKFINAGVYGTWPVMVLKQEGKKIKEIGFLGCSSNGELEAITDEDQDLEVREDFCPSKCAHYFKEWKTQLTRQIGRSSKFCDGDMYKPGWRLAADTGQLLLQYRTRKGLRAHIPNMEEAGRDKMLRLLHWCVQQVEQSKRASHNF
eukprot:NODE_974_length_1526_cov_150.615440_g963_i0.p1 GENE.NODE_974_length_1526_cov_150.615440_g963_i0~~NODE_974_length_1526_cov_150.615440_g963_i0.p1  ORF type:complete len:436 (+),score=87.79 NODE_974_length_1526_cov_150.615440_g963_i0:109-1416(+)